MPHLNYCVTAASCTTTSQKDTRYGSNRQLAHTRLDLYSCGLSDFFALIAEVGASRGTVITYVNPAVSVFLGVTLLSEPLNAAIIIGFMLILLGSWLSTSGVIPLKSLLRTRQEKKAGVETEVSIPDTSPQKLQ